MCVCVCVCVHVHVAIQYYTHTIMVVGGSLMMAKGGVCLLGNLRKWKKENKELLQKSKI